MQSYDLYVTMKQASWPNDTLIYITIAINGHHIRGKEKQLNRITIHIMHSLWLVSSNATCA